MHTEPDGNECCGGGGVVGGLPPTFIYKPLQRCNSQLPSLEQLQLLNLGNYSRGEVTNAALGSVGRAFFDIGLRLFHAYQHELAAKVFRACVQFSPNCALAYSFVALCHSPNYNFNSDHYYTSTYCSLTGESVNENDAFFPSQAVAAKYARMAMNKVEELRKRYRVNKNGSDRKNTYNKVLSGIGDDDVSRTSCEPERISEAETLIITAVHLLSSHPGIDAKLAEEVVGRPYANYMRKVHSRFRSDPDIAYLFAESLMVLNAWKLYQYPTGRSLSPDVDEIQRVLEAALESHREHAGLCHLYIHLCEMSKDPSKAMSACNVLRTIPDAGHLIHMSTHIDVLVGDYEAVIRYNEDAIRSDNKVSAIFPDENSPTSFYYGYMAHNYHMLVYGTILGGMEGKGMEYARELTRVLNEDLFEANPTIATYLECYAALDIHVLLRFGRWDEILELSFPRNHSVMLYRTGALRAARAISFANKRDISLAKTELFYLEEIQRHPTAAEHIIHNNSVDRVLEVEVEMVRGEIAYFEGEINEAFRRLRNAVTLQDSLNYDEPQGKMQPVRHALGALLLKEGQTKEAESTFRADLQFHPRNPWAMVGLIECLKRNLDSADTLHNAMLLEYQYYMTELNRQRQSEFADYKIVRPCNCAL